MNKIEKIRDEIKRYYDADQFIKNSEETFVSPDKKFRAETAEYHQNKPGLNWDVTRVRIFDNISEEILFEFTVNDRFFHSWLTVGGIDYLICAEDMCGGQTIIDLTHKQMSSYSEDVDGFIWTDFHLSPDEKTIAVRGCVWAYPFAIRIYDFRRPMDLPLREIKEVDLIDGEDFVGWFDNRSVKTRRRVIDDGTANRTVAIDGSEIERIIQIDE